MTNKTDLGYGSWMDKKTLQHMSIMNISCSSFFVYMSKVKGTLNSYFEC